MAYPRHIGIGWVAYNDPPKGIWPAGHTVKGSSMTKTTTGYRITQGTYWLSVGAWFGAVVMVVITAATTFQTVRDYQPTLGLEPYNQPGLVDKAAPILAGGIVGNVLGRMAVLELVCGGIALVCVALQCTRYAGRITGGVWGRANVLRVGLLVGAVMLVVLDAGVIGPRIRRERSVMHDTALSEQTRAESKAAFDRLHKLDERVVGATALLLIATVFASSFALHGHDVPDHIDITPGSTSDKPAST